MAKKTEALTELLSLLLWMAGTLVCETISSALMIFFAIALHECGHLLAFICLGEPMPTLHVGRLGLQLNAASPLSYRAQLLTAMAGPLMNLLCFALFSFSGVTLFSYIHLFTALGNLMPICTLDGGRILESLLGLYFPYCFVYKICRAVSLICLFTGLLASLACLFVAGEGSYLYFLFFSLFLRHIADNCKTV